MRQSLNPHKVLDWRDPYIWREAKQWYMLLAGRYAHESGGSVFCYRSPDLEEWHFDGRIYHDPQNNLECPNMLRFDQRYVLVISPYAQVRYAVGLIERNKFIPQRWWMLDHGQDFYATNTYIDNEMGYKLIGWLRVKGNDAWNGCLSLPRHLTLDKTGELHIEPVTALQSLRIQSLEFNEERIVSGNCLEIQATYSPHAGPRCRLELRDDERSYPLNVDLSSGRIEALSEVRQLERLVPVKPLRLHIFIDTSVVEVFINGRVVLSTWLRPNLKCSTHWQVRFSQKPEKVMIWELAPI